MRNTAWPALLFFVTLLAVAVPSSGQTLGTVLESFEVHADGTQAIVPVSGFGYVTMEFCDTSRDSVGSASPGGPGLPNRAVIHVTPVEGKTGWLAAPLPASINSHGGQCREFQIQFSVDPTATDPFFQVNVTVVFHGVSNQDQTANLTALAYSPGLESFTAQVSESYTLKPKQIVDVPLKIRNTALTPRSFDMKVVENPCAMNVGTTNGNSVQPKSVEEYTVSIQAPSKKLWYPYDSCSISVEVRPQDNMNQVRTAIINVQVAGFHVNPQWVIWLVEITVVLLLLILLVRRRKARVEEEILGKPQKPWTIPVEALYLKALRAKDERAWYVVRHHLMEEEYRSSLLWYKSFKAATKGSRKKESLVLRQEKAYQRWQKAWKRAIARPLKDAARFEAKLQRKLDRKALAQHRKQVGKAGAVRAKMEAAHAKQVERALAAWEKDTRKAQKKGLPLPRRPSLPEPDYPEDPEEVGIRLKDHKWSRKADRFRARMVRKQGDLEVKFEKADARRLRRLRRKVQRLARKLDDPQFIEEHPLLRAEKA